MRFAFCAMRTHTHRPPPRAFAPKARCFVACSHHDLTTHKKHRHFPNTHSFWVQPPPLSSSFVTSLPPCLFVFGILVQALPPIVVCPGGPAAPSARDHHHTTAPLTRTAAQRTEMRRAPLAFSITHTRSLSPTQPPPSFLPHPLPLSAHALAFFRFAFGLNMRRRRGLLATLPTTTHSPPISSPRRQQRAIRPPFFSSPPCRRRLGLQSGPGCGRTPSLGDGHTKSHRYFFSFAAWRVKKRKRGFVCSWSGAASFLPLVFCHHSPTSGR